MIAIRDLPKTVASDNGSNFIRAITLLHELSLMLQFDETNDVIGSMEVYATIFAYFGCSHEASVKSLDLNFCRTKGSVEQTFEQLSPSVKGIEAMLESRPLTNFLSSLDALQCLVELGNISIGHRRYIAVSSAFTRTFNWKRLDFIRRYI